jgi:hypothetical protein
VHSDNACCVDWSSSVDFCSADLKKAYRCCSSLTSLQTSSVGIFRSGSSIARGQNFCRTKSTATAPKRKYKSPKQIPYLARSSKYISTRGCLALMTMSIQRSIRAPKNRPTFWPSCLTISIAHKRRYGLSSTHIILGVAKGDELTVLLETSGQLTLISEC